MPSEPELKVLHGEFLFLLELFHKLCIKNDIKYSLHGGSLLGAIREKGFIPWDDDVDITLIRSEFDRLCTILEKTKLGEGIRFESLERTYKLIMKRKDKPVVWIDIQVYDYISENPISQKLKIYITCFFAGFLRKQRKELLKAKLRGQGGWKYVAYTMAYLLGRPFPLSLRFQMWQMFCKKCFCGKKKLIYRSNDQYTGMIMIFPVRVMDSYINIPFEDLEAMVTAKYHEILVASYGDDYMVPKRYGENEAEAHEINRKMLD